MLQQLRSILAVEAEARAEVERVRTEASRLVAAAEEEARRLVRQARESSEAVAGAAEDACVDKARAQAEAILEVQRGEITRLREFAAPRCDGAVHAVVEALMPDTRSFDGSRDDG